MIPAELPSAASDFAAPTEVSSHSRAQAYYNQLHSWCIIQQLPNFQRAVIARFRKRNDAEAYLKALHHLTPNANYLIIFEPPKAIPLRNVRYRAIRVIRVRNQLSIFAVHQQIEHFQDDPTDQPLQWLL